MIQKYLLSKAKEIQMVLFGSVTNGTYFYGYFIAFLKYNISI